MRVMKVIFLAGPFRGDGSKEAQKVNIEKAKQYAKKFVANKIPFYSPHLNLSQVTVEMDKDVEEYAIPVQSEFLERCDALAVLPGWKDSLGTLEEIEMAKKKGMKIFYLEQPNAMSDIKEFAVDSV